MCNACKESHLSESFFKRCFQRGQRFAKDEEYIAVVVVGRYREESREKKKRKTIQITTILQCSDTVHCSIFFFANDGDAAS